MRSKQADQKRRHDAHSRDRSFDIGQSVLVQNLRDVRSKVDSRNSH